MRIGLIAFAAALLLLVAGCGGQGDTGGSSNPLTGAGGTVISTPTVPQG